MAAGHEDRHAPLKNYCRGLLLPGDRKSIEPMAARLDPEGVQSMRQSLHRLPARGRRAESRTATSRSRLPHLHIPMMSISHSDLMPISSERSDAGLSQCETVIDIRQEFSAFSCRESLGVAVFCFLALTEGARRATGVSAKKQAAVRRLLTIFSAPPTSLLTHRLAL